MGLLDDKQRVVQRVSGLFCYGTIARDVARITLHGRWPKALYLKSFLPCEPKMERIGHHWRAECPAVFGSSSQCGA